MSALGGGSSSGGPPIPPPAPNPATAAKTCATVKRRLKNAKNGEVPEDISAWLPRPEYHHMLHPGSGALEGFGPQDPMAATAGSQSSGGDSDAESHNESTGYMSVDQSPTHQHCGKRTRAHSEGSADLSSYSEESDHWERWKPPSDTFVSGKKTAFAKKKEKASKARDLSTVEGVRASARRVMRKATKRARKRTPKVTQGEEVKQKLQHKGANLFPAPAVTKVYAPKTEKDEFIEAPEAPKGTFKIPDALVTKLMDAAELCAASHACIEEVLRRVVKKAIEAFWLWERHKASDSLVLGGERELNAVLLLPRFIEQDNNTQPPASLQFTVVGVRVQNGTEIHEAALSPNPYKSITFGGTSIKPKSDEYEGEGTAADEKRRLLKERQDCVAAASLYFKVGGNFPEFIMSNRQEVDAPDFDGEEAVRGLLLTTEHKLSSVKVSHAMVRKLTHATMYPPPFRRIVEARARTAMSETCTASSLRKALGLELVDEMEDEDSDEDDEELELAVVSLRTGGAASVESLIRSGLCDNAQQAQIVLGAEGMVVDAAKRAREGGSRFSKIAAASVDTTNNCVFVAAREAAGGSDPHSLLNDNNAHSEAILLQELKKAREKNPQFSTENTILIVSTMPCYKCACSILKFVYGDGSDLDSPRFKGIILGDSNGVTWSGLSILRLCAERIVVDGSFCANYIRPLWRVSQNMTASAAPSDLEFEETHVLPKKWTYPPTFGAAVIRESVLELLEGGDLQAFGHLPVMSILTEHLQLTSRQRATQRARDRGYQKFPFRQLLRISRGEWGLQQMLKFVTYANLMALVSPPQASSPSAEASAEACKFSSLELFTAATSPLPKLWDIYRGRFRPGTANGIKPADLYRDGRMAFDRHRLPLTHWKDLLPEGHRIHTGKIGVTQLLVENEYRLRHPKFTVVHGPLKSVYANLFRDAVDCSMKARLRKNDTAAIDESDAQEPVDVSEEKILQAVILESLSNPTAVSTKSKFPQPFTKQDLDIDEGSDVNIAPTKEVILSSPSFSVMGEPLSVQQLDAAGRIVVEGTHESTRAANVLRTLLNTVMPEAVIDTIVQHELENVNATLPGVPLSALRKAKRFVKTRELFQPFLGDAASDLPSLDDRLKVAQVLSHSVRSAMQDGIDSCNGDSNKQAKWIATCLRPATALDYDGTVIGAEGFACGRARLVRHVYMLHSLIEASSPASLQDKESATIKLKKAVNNVLEVLDDEAGMEDLLDVQRLLNKQELAHYVDLIMEDFEVNDDVPEKVKKLLSANKSDQWGFEVAKSRANQTSKKPPRLAAAVNTAKRKTAAQERPQRGNIANIKKAKTIAAREKLKPDTDAFAVCAIIGTAGEATHIETTFYRGKLPSAGYNFRAERANCCSTISLEKYLSPIQIAALTSFRPTEASVAGYEPSADGHWSRVIGAVEICRSREHLSAEAISILDANRGAAMESLVRGIPAYCGGPVDTRVSTKVNKKDEIVHVRSTQQAKAILAATRRVYVPMNITNLLRVGLDAQKNVHMDNRNFASAAATQFKANDKHGAALSADSYGITTSSFADVFKRVIPGGVESRITRALAHAKHSETCVVNLAKTLANRGDSQIVFDVTAGGNTRAWTATVSTSLSDDHQQLLIRRHILLRYVTTDGILMQSRLRLKNNCPSIKIHPHFNDERDMPTPVSVTYTHKTGRKFPTISITLKRRVPVMPATAGSRRGTQVATAEALPAVVEDGVKKLAELLADDVRQEVERKIAAVHENEVAACDQKVQHDTPNSANRKSKRRRQRVKYPPIHRPTEGIKLKEGAGAPRSAKDRRCIASEDLRLARAATRASRLMKEHRNTVVRNLTEDDVRICYPGQPSSLRARGIQQNTKGIKKFDCLEGIQDKRDREMIRNLGMYAALSQTNGLHSVGGDPGIRTMSCLFVQGSGIVIFIGDGFAKDERRTGKRIAGAQSLEAKELLKGNRDRAEYWRTNKRKLELSRLHRVKQMHYIGKCVLSSICSVASMGPPQTAKFAKASRKYASGPLSLVGKDAGVLAYGSWLEDLKESFKLSYYNGQNSAATHVLKSESHSTGTCPSGHHYNKCGGSEFHICPVCGTYLRDPNSGRTIELLGRADWPATGFPPMTMDQIYAEMADRLQRLPDGDLQYIAPPEAPFGAGCNPKLSGSPLRDT